MVELQTQTYTGYRWRWLGLIAVLVAEAANMLDATVVQVAGPVVHRQLGGAVADVQWFGAAYTLAFAVLLVTGGRLGDIIGRKQIFRYGMVGFLIFSIGCAAAPNAGALIGFRALQGASAALVIPQTFGMIRAMFDGAELSTALGSIGPVMGLATVCGPVLGGVLTHLDLFGSSWRAAFLLNAPLAVGVLALTPMLRDDRSPHRPRLDLPGTALATVGTSLIVYPLIAANDTWLVAVGVAVLVAFALHQRYAAGTPLVERSLFAGRSFPAALATSALFFAVMTGLMQVVSLALQLGGGAGPLVAGLTLLPWSVGLAVTSWVSGARLVPKHGARVRYAGLALTAVGVAAAALTYPIGHAYPWAVLPALGVAGLGVGLFTPAFFTAALTPVRPHETGSAAGLLNAVQQLGSTLGTAVLGTLYLAHGARPAFWLAAALVAVATALMT